MAVRDTVVEKFQTRIGRDIERFLAEKRNRSSKTEQAYRSDFSRFIKAEFNKTINTITKEELESLTYDKVFDYRQSLIGEVSNSTVNRYMSSIKSVITHLKIIDSIESDVSYLKAIKNLPNNGNEIEYMSREVVDRYIHEAGNEQNNALLKQTLIIFAVETGLRMNECLSITKGQFTVDEDHVKIKGYGKGNKEYSDKISKNVYDRVMKASRAVHSNDKIFDPLNRKNVTDMMDRLKIKLGYQDRQYSFHSFKKHAVTAAYRKTGDIMEAKRKGRHASLATTQRYLKEEDYGPTGAFSLQSHDDNLYKKVKNDLLIEAIGEMGKDFKHLLNLKLSKKMES